MMKARNLMPFMIVLACLQSGCAMLIVQPGKYAMTLREGKSREEVRERIGAPILSSLPAAPERHPAFLRSVYDEEYSFDVFRVHGKIYEPDSDRVVGYGMASGMSFLLAEIILTPVAIGQVFHESFTDRYLKVWYDESLKYQRHETGEIEQPAQQELRNRKPSGSPTTPPTVPSPAPGAGEIR